MLQFETLLLMLAAAVALIALARRWHLPYPVLLAMAGTAIALANVDVRFDLEPELVLALFVAPVLLDAAYDMSGRDLARYWGAVASLAVLVVILTTVAVAGVVHALVPGIPWAAAIAIGAIVAPPDAAAASTVLRSVGLPHRVGVILEGEALLNDASSLLIYRLAVGAVATGGSIGAAAIAPAFGVSVLGSLVVGPLLGWLVARLEQRIADVPSAIIGQFLMTYAAWVIAERLGLSPILTVVAYAMTLTRSQIAHAPAHLRVSSNTVWATVVVLLNAFAFLVIGLDLGPVLQQAGPGELQRWAIVGAAVLATVVGVRLVWAIGAALWRQWRHRRTDGQGSAPNWRTGLVVGWAGTRGIVTVATALALPHDFPERPMLLFVAFTVTLGTLLLQGLTLRPLVQRLALRDDGMVEREIRQARVETAQAALHVLDTDMAGAETGTLRDELQAECQLAARSDEGEGRPSLPVAGVRARVLGIRRERLHALRDAGRIGDDAFRRLEQELDLSELAIRTRL